MRQLRTRPHLRPLTQPTLNYSCPIRTIDHGKHVYFILYQIHYVICNWESQNTIIMPFILTIIFCILEGAYSSPMWSLRGLCKNIFLVILVVSYWQIGFKYTFSSWSYSNTKVKRVWNGYVLMFDMKYKSKDHIINFQTSIGDPPFTRCSS